MAGVNASVVGLLGAALYNPLWTSSVRTPVDLGVALVGFLLLTAWRIPPLYVVLFTATVYVTLNLVALRRLRGREPVARP